MKSKLVRIWGRNVQVCRLWKGILDERRGR